MYLFAVMIYLIYPHEKTYACCEGTARFTRFSLKKSQFKAMKSTVKMEGGRFCTWTLSVTSEAAKSSNETILYDVEPSSHTEEKAGFDAI